MVVYIPILALTGVEGKMFHPMAFTVVMALLGAHDPVGHLRARGGRAVRHRPRGGEGEPADAWARKRLIEPLLEPGAAEPAPMVAGRGVVLVVLSGLLATRMGTEFVPSLDEGDIALHALRIPAPA